MKENISNKIVLLCLLAVMVSCKSKKGLVATNNTSNTTATSMERSEEKHTIAQIKSAQLNFNTFSGKAKAKLTIDNSSNDVTLNIRIASGKKIWISVTALLGIEVARAEVTPDSILVMDRLHGVYFKKPFSFIYTYANHQVNYKTLESFFIGNAVPEMLNEKAKMTPDNGSIHLSGNLEELTYQLIVDANRRVSQTNMADEKAGRSLQVNNSVYIQSGMHTVPSQVNISSMAEKKKVQMDIRYTKVDFDISQEYPFSIPEDYKPQN